MNNQDEISIKKSHQLTELINIVQKKQNYSLLLSPTKKKHKKKLYGLL